MKKTVIIGATTNPSRYAYTAAQMLADKKIDFVPVGIKTGVVLGKDILDLNTQPKIQEVDTITLYLGPTNQSQWLDYLVSLKPKRIIFNPGTENPELYTLAKANGIQCLNACTLVMLSTGQF
jgi:uncharacterized protein